MMSLGLRILLIFAASVSCVCAIRKIRKSQIKIEEAIFWFFMLFVILLLSIFPSSGIWMAKFLGVESPANLIYLVMIFILGVKVFFLSLKNCQIEYKLWILSQEIAIWKNQIENGRGDKEK